MNLKFKGAGRQDQGGLGIVASTCCECNVLAVRSHRVRGVLFFVSFVKLKLKMEKK
jgi:hypothetical protein